MVRQKKGEFQKPISNVSKEASGAQKLKRKRQQEEAKILRERNKKYYIFGDSKRVAAIPIVESNQEPETETNEIENANIIQLSDSPHDPTEECEELDESSEIHESESEPLVSNKDDCVEEWKNVDCLDPYTWPEFVPEALKKKIISAKVNYKNTNAHPILQFWKTYVEGTKPNGEFFLRDWLRVSVKSNSAFCLPCCFFLPSIANKTCWSNYSGEGYMGFNHSLQGVKRHEIGGSHLEAVRRMKSNILEDSNEASLKSLLSVNYKEYVEQWKLILRGIVDAAFFLAQNNLAFQGKSLKIEDSNCGNFLNLIKLLGKYYTPLGNHVENLKTNRVSYLSPKIQNEFISIMGGKVKGEVLQQTRDRKYFGVCFDSTPDYSHNEQVSMIVRTVNCSQLGCQIEEHFVEFISTLEKTGKGLSDEFIKALKRNNLDIQNCRGQGYDNGANMSGKYKGVQAFIQRINNEARFVPCAAHSLNLVGVNAAEEVQEAKFILGEIQNVYNFFSSSTSRWNVLKTYSKISVKCQSKTRWSSKYAAVSSLLDNFEKVLAALEEISYSNDFRQVASSAKSLLRDMMSFKFFLGLIIWNQILFKINSCNLSLQSQKIDVSYADKQLSTLLKDLLEFKDNGFQKWVKIAEEKAIKIGIDVESGFENVRRGRGVNSKYDGAERAAILRSMSNLDRFEIEFFDTLLNKLVQEMTKRFEQIRDCVSDFSFLWGDGLKMNFDSKVKCVQNLMQKYPNDFSASGFLSEIDSLHSIVDDFKPKVGKVKDKKVASKDAETPCGPLDVLNIIYKNGFENSYVNCETALRIFLTLPVSVASNERAFSKLKIIKNYLRSTMGQERLNSLSILSIENEIASGLDMDEVINDFVAIKCRRVSEI